jgi:hypothetical protein
MAIMESQMAFPEPWSDLRDGDPENDEQREALRAELAEELSAGHVLHDRELIIVARSEANDDVLVALDDGTWALVHLTWRGTAERAPWPTTVVFSAVMDAVAAMLE